ncbi:HDAg domain-containing protein [Aphelenchoides fujianensis]|nr:HDAg domain-containing protein [Aphelenchoides fujianensis]
MMMNAAMNANQLKGFDLVNWLNNKLGDTGELWAGKTASGVLTREIINELANCFPALEPHVKLKIIESLPYISPKLMQMWKEPLVQLLLVAKEDADQWIRTLAAMYVTYPQRGAIKSDIDDDDQQFAQTTQDFQKILEEVIPTLGVNIVPPDFHIVSASATTMAFGYSACDPLQHFKLRKESKSAKMLQDALKACEAANNPAHRRFAPGSASTVPVRARPTVRKTENTLPMRGIPTVPASRISCGFSNKPKKFQRTLTKRAGGAMLLDISDLPQPPTGKKQRRPAPPPAAAKPPADGKPEEPKKRGRKPKQQPSADAAAAPADEQDGAAAEAAVEKSEEAIEQPPHSTDRQPQPADRQPQAEQKTTPNYPWYSGGYDPTATESFEPSGGDSSIGEGVIARPVTSGGLYARPPPLMQQQRPDEQPQPLLRNFITPFGQQSASSFDSPNGGFGAFTYF